MVRKMAGRPTPLRRSVTHSPVKAGAVSFAQFLPIVLFSLISGVAGTASTASG
jgi:hypothetical protein